MLLVTAAVLLRGARRLSTMDVGLRTSDVLSLDINEPSRPRVLAELAASPLVLNYGATSAIPLDRAGAALSVGASDSQTLIAARYRNVSPEYFDVLGLPIVSGRVFTPEEAAAGTPVAIISEATARAVWPNRNPVGQSLHVVPSARTGAGPFAIRDSVVTVVGVSGDHVMSGPWKRALVFPVAKTAVGTSIVLRVRGDAETARRTLDAAITAAAPGAIEEIHAMQDFVAVQLYPFRAAYWVAGIIGWLALLLTLSGVYGVLSYVVTQRTKEIGIRIALGAGVRSIVALVFGHTLRFVAIGLPAGALLALGAAQLFSTMAGEVDLFDFTAYLFGMAVVMAACLAASLVPAWRAARLDPIATLRAD
jgi:hypothetical protein